MTRLLVYERGRAVRQRLAAAGFLGLFLVVTLYTFFGALPAFGIYRWPARAFFHALVGLTLAGWLGWKWATRRDLPATPLDRPVLALLAAVALSTLLSTDPRLSLQGWLTAVAYALAFYLLLDLLRHPTAGPRLLGAVLVMMAVVCVFGFTQLGQWYSSLPGVAREGVWRSTVTPLRPPSVFENTNFLAAYLVLLLPLAAYRWLGAQTRPARFLSALGLLLVLMLLLLTASRGGLLGLAAEGLIALGYWLFRRRRAGQRLGFLVVIGALLLGAAGAAVLARRGFSLSEAPTQDRIALWRAALLMARDRPLWGVGPLTFATQLPRYVSPLALTRTFNHAHSLYLHLLAETGALGILAALWAAVALIVLFLRHGHTPGRFSLATAGFIGLVGFAVHGAVDSFFNSPALILHALLLAAAVASACPASSRPGLPVRRIVATGLLLLLSAATVWTDRGYALLYDAQVAARAGDWQGAVRSLETAVRLDPGVWFYRQERALAYGYLACRDPACLAPALAAYQDSLRAFDDWALDHANAAVLYGLAGQEDAAIAEMRHARALRPAEPLYACHLGRLLEAAGQIEGARSAYADCLMLAPDLFTATFWQETPWRAAALPQVARQAEEALSAPDERLARAALRAHLGDLSGALADVRQFQRQHPSAIGGRVEEARLLALMGQEQAALERLDRLLARSPAAADALLLRGQIHLWRGDLTQAAADLRDSAALVSSPQSAWWLGRLAEVQGDDGRAMRYYREAAVTALRQHTSEFASLIVYRFPLASEPLPCLTTPRPYETFAAPAMALARLLAAHGRCREAENVYRVVAAEEPGLARVWESMGRPPCPEGR